MAGFRLPRLVVAGLSGSAGKTLVAAGLARALARRGDRVAAYKKGPDFIDVSWLGAASGAPARSLDSFMMESAALLSSLERAGSATIAIIEGNRGLFDGLDERGSHSTAALARQLDAPVVLVVDVAKCTRTVAALVLGCLALEPDLRLAGVILNRVGTRRQESVIRDALGLVTDVPVLGAIPRLAGDLLPSRHLGLVMPAERSDVDRALDAMADAVSAAVDLTVMKELAEGAPALCAPHSVLPPTLRGRGRADLSGGLAARESSRAPVRVGILRDEAFSFYYIENLEALEAEGAVLVPISPLRDRTLPPIDALYAGGGYPEEHAARLSANTTFRESLRARVGQGLPVWAECGGLMYLAREIAVGETRYPMVDALPLSVVQMSRPQAHGYVEAVVDTENPFLPLGTRLRGHEFHYSCLGGESSTEGTVMALERGMGVGAGRDGIVRGSVLASYLHIFAPGAPFWAPALVRMARRARADHLEEGESHGQHFSRRPSDRGRRGRVHPGA